MNIKHFIGMTLVAMSFVACDDTTGNLGNSLTNTADQFEILTDTFKVKTRSIIVDSVLSRGQYSYLGHIKDTETGTYITSHYTTQFAILESLDGTTLFPPRDSIASVDTEGNVIADSCRMQIYFYSSIGDSLNAMKLTAYELAKPVEEGKLYYTDFNPEENGLIRADGIKKSKAYTTLDLNLSDSSRALVVNKTHMESVTISMNDSYTDKDGKTYNNYGTYLMRKFYENPDNYKSSYSFTHNVCPGFYIKSTDGLGVMSAVYLTELVLFYKHNNDSLYYSSNIFSGTEEVLQTTNIINDKTTNKTLADDKTCTYLKAPAGIFTEVELPVNEIKFGHENDTISSAKIVFNRLRSMVEDSYIGTPTSILMIPKDSLYTFFEKKNLPDNKYSFMGVNNDAYNTYTFNNISSLVSAMYEAKRNGNASENWNKVVLVPVTVEKNTSSTNSTTTGVSHEMSLKSTRLVGGEQNSRQPITISVIYNRFYKE